MDGFRKILPKPRVLGYRWPMLLSFSMRNFRSFVDEAVLDLASSTLRTNVPRAGQSWADVSERVVAIYGANAAGKTTVLEAIWALSLALRAPGSNAIWQPSADGGERKPIEFKVDFVAAAVRYVYEVHAAEWGVSYEALHSYPKGTRRLVFSRSREEEAAETRFERGSTLAGPTSEVLRITRPTALFLATAHTYGHTGLVAAARALVADLGVSFITFRDRQDEAVLRRVLMEMLDAPAEQIGLVSALLRAADVGISSVEVRKEEVPEEVWKRVRRLLETLREGVDGFDQVDFPRLQDVVTFRHTGKDGKPFLLPVRSESAGTITWLTTAWHALNALRDGGVLLIDELDASLHPELARYIVKLFLLPQLNPHGAQLIFTTHDVSLLSNAPARTLEPRNVWFVEKDAAGRSELFCLDDFDNRAGNNNERRYLAGQFGATPEIDDSLLLRYLASTAAEEVAVGA